MSRYPGLIAPASLKRMCARLTLLAASCYPGLIAPASLKRMLLAQTLKQALPLSGVNRLGLIEALAGDPSNCLHTGYPGLIAPASLKHEPRSDESPRSSQLSGVNRPGLIEARQFFNDDAISNSVIRG